MKTFSILYHRYLSRPQEFVSELANKTDALAEATAFIKDGYPRIDCNPLLVIDWNTRDLTRFGYESTATTFELKEDIVPIGPANPNLRFQFIYQTHEDAEEAVALPCTVSGTFDAAAGTAAAAASFDQMPDPSDENLPPILPFCLIDWDSKELLHLARDINGVTRILPNYPSEPVGLYTPYESNDFQAP